MKIVVGYDNAAVSSKVLSLAIGHAKAFKAHIILVTCLTGDSATIGEEISNAEERLAKAKKTVINEGVSCGTELLIRGVTPGEDLVTLAQEIDAYEIILGIKKRSKTGILFFGSNVQYVVLNTDCAVVTVK
ncbi:MAG: universal stress protein [Pseudomonadota bacterium]